MVEIKDTGVRNSVACLLNQWLRTSSPDDMDSRNGEAVMELLGDLHQNGATICMVTHDPRFARHAERTVHLFDGRIVADGKATA